MTEGGKKRPLPGMEDLVEKTKDKSIDPFPFEPVESPESELPPPSGLGGRSGYTAGDQSRAMDEVQERAQDRAQKRREESGEKLPGQTSDKGS